MKESEKESYLEALEKFVKWRKMNMLSREASSNDETNGSKLNQAAVTEADLNKTLNDFINCNHYENVGDKCFEHTYDVPYEYESDAEYSTIPIPSSSSQPPLSPPSPPLSQIIITDLDASQSNNITHDDFDFLMGTWGDVQLNDISPFTFANSYVQHGEFHSDSVSVMSAMSSTKDTYAGECNNFYALKQCRHPNIVLLMGIILDDYSKLTALLVEPLKCSLYDMIYQEKSYMDLRQCHNYLEQLANAVGYLHLKRILHTNICSENVIISRLSQTVKLAGFELCITIDGASAFSYFSHNPANRATYTKHYYQAPELLSPPMKPAIQSDIYGVCLLLWEMLNCHLPYVHLSQDELAKLKGTTLTVFRKRRCIPFKTVLEKGLAIPAELRYLDIRSLKIDLKIIGKLDLTAYDDQANTTKHANGTARHHIRSNLYRVNIIVSSKTNDNQTLDDISEAFSDFYIDDDLNESNNVNIALRIN
ncbi:uncharacterized protein ACN2A1_011241 [Glossina fuscipes fuscipes]